MKESYLNLLSRDLKSNDHLSSLGQSSLFVVSLHPLQPEICGVTNMIMPLAYTQGEKVPITLALKIKLLHLPCQAYNLQNPAWQAPTLLSSHTWPTNPTVSLQPHLPSSVCSLYQGQRPLPCSSLCLEPSSFFSSPG